ncbi:MAG: hypothetical protein R2764_20835 [Bacteroidales bacterium]
MSAGYGDHRNTLQGAAMNDFRYASECSILHGAQPLWFASFWWSPFSSPVI